MRPGYLGDHRVSDVVKYILHTGESVRHDVRARHVRGVAGAWAGPRLEARGAARYGDDLGDDQEQAGRTSKI